jgi:hypothetical protein
VARNVSDSHLAKPHVLNQNHPLSRSQAKVQTAGDAPLEKPANIVMDNLVSNSAMEENLVDYVPQLQNV